MQLVACGLLIAVGVAFIAAAMNPDLPLARSIYWWRVLFKRSSRPGTYERLSAVIGGMLYIALGGGILVYLCVVR
jgi:hypothetical protein